MDRNPVGLSNRRLSSRAGFVRPSAFRELMLVGIGAALVVWVLCEANQATGFHFSSREGDTVLGTQAPVLALEFNDDRQSLVVQTYPDAVEEFTLAEQSDPNVTDVNGLVSIASSRQNSTIAMLAQRNEGTRISYIVSVIRDEEFVLSEKIKPTGSTADLRISDDGRVVLLVSQEGSGTVWDLSQSEPKRWNVQFAHKTNTNCLSPDGQTLFAVSHEGQASILNLKTGMVQISFPKIQACSRTAKWSADGQQIAYTNMQGCVFVVDSATGAPVWQYQMEFLCSRCLTFSPDGSTLAIGGFDKQIRVFDLTAPMVSVKVFSGSSSVVMDLAFNSNGTKLISGCLDGSLREWSVASNTMVRQLR